VLKTARELTGVLLKDWWRYVAATSRPAVNGHDADWVRLCNRIEQFEPNPDGRGVRCLWQFGSDLHAPLHLRHLGRWVMEAALRDWPIRFTEAPVGRGPRVSFLFAHGGVDRLTQLQWTLRSVFAQTDVEVECVVVDQSETPLAAQLPPDVRYVRLDKSRVAAGWYKSWAFNVAARHATGDILVFHDGDICVPERYAAELCRVLSGEKYRAASLQRMLFYLDPGATERVYVDGTVPVGVTPTRIFQNWKGGTIAVRRKAYFELGGFDEGFVDWGGEDDEFYHRCEAVCHCRYGFLPFIHLWHAPQPDRREPGNINTAGVLPKRLIIPVQTRIEELLARNAGDPAGPRPEQSYKRDLIDLLAGT
jgi:hypothetical protein